MAQLVRVLEVFHGMDCGGAENMIMNIYREMDRTKIQLDFLVHTNKRCFFDDEIESIRLFDGFRIIIKRLIKVLIK